MGEPAFLTPFWLTDGGTFAPNLGFWESGSTADFSLVLCMRVVQKISRDIWYGFTWFDPIWNFLLEFMQWFTFACSLFFLYDGDTRRADRDDEKKEALSISECWGNQRGAAKPDSPEKYSHPRGTLYRLRGWTDREGYGSTNKKNQNYIIKTEIGRLFWKE